MNPCGCILIQLPGGQTVIGRVGSKPYNYAGEQAALTGTGTLSSLPEPTPAGLQRELDADVCKNCGLAVPPADPTSHLCDYCAQLQAVQPELPKPVKHRRFQLDTPAAIAVASIIAVIAVMLIFVLMEILWLNASKLPDLDDASSTTGRNGPTAPFGVRFKAATLQLASLASRPPYISEHATKDSASRPGHPRKGS
jgi:hypothetical protein